MLATELEPSGTDDRGPRASLLETHSANERMRHIPPLSWLVQKLDRDVRRRIEILWLPYSDLPASDPRHPAMEAAFRALCRWIDRVADCARRSRGSHPPNDLRQRLQFVLAQAVANLQAADAETFGRRFPFQTFERSNAEPLRGAFLAVLFQLDRIADLVREIEPELDERLLEGLVTLEEPLRREPIA